MNIQRITIVGLGLIGGSLAKALRRTNPNFEIIGVDKDKENLKSALEDCTINQAYEHLDKAVIGSQVIFLCTPVQNIPNILGNLSTLVDPGTIITDVGSTKQEIMNIAKNVLPDSIYFIGGHPMAGTEHSGYAASIAHLFENAYYILTPPSDIPKDIVETLILLISSTGALPLIIDPITHDQKVGAISHLPHVVAAALVNTVNDLEDPQHSIQKLAAGGFKDITRIASSNPEMWRDISLSNKQQLIPLISSMIRNLYKFGLDLEKDEADVIEEFYKNAKAFRDQLPSINSLFLLPYYELYVDVEDKPGIIGQVTTILGNNNINIKNIRIINSREDEPGCLVLSLPDQQAQEKAEALLLSQDCHAYKR